MIVKIETITTPLVKWPSLLHVRVFLLTPSGYGTCTSHRCARLFKVSYFFVGFLRLVRFICLNYQWGVGGGLESGEIVGKLLPSWFLYEQAQPQESV